MIESCSFGSITIDGNTYRSDVMIFPDGRVRDAWRRRKGHQLSEADIQPLLDAQPEVIVAGTGVSGLMRPDKGLAELLAARGITFLAARNSKAMQLFNTDFHTALSVMA